MESMQDYKEMTELVSLDGRTTDAVVMFFLALIGMACTYGSFLGLQAALDARADQTPLAVRRSVTPLHKGKVIFLDFVVAVTIHFCSVLVLLAYIHFGMKISLGEDVLRMLPVCLAGVVEGVAFGVIIGCLRKISEPAKIGINIGINMFFSFCAGLMDNQTKILIDNNVPLLNKINPVALITDAFYCIAVYDSPAKYQQNILMLTGIAAVLLVAAFLMIRREVYDSI